MKSNQTGTSVSCAGAIFGHCFNLVSGPLLVISVGLLSLGSATAESIQVPNNSFELPTTALADPRIQSWQKSPKPDWYTNADFPWEQLTGVFLNTPAGMSNHIDNIDGNQGLFLFALPQVEVFQDYNSVSGTNGTPDQAFGARFELGKAYDLTVGVIGGGGGMTNGATMELGLYYRQAGTNLVRVAATTVTNTPDQFPNTTHFVDFHVHVPTVQASDPWAGQYIGVQLLSTVAPNLAGGYWDLDNVRLAEAASAGLTLSVGASGSNVRIAWPSVAGMQYQLKMSNDLKTWTDFEPPQAGTGNELSKLVPTSGQGHAFFVVIATPAG